MDLIRRDAWGAAPPRGKPNSVLEPVRDLFIHHSAGPDGSIDVVRGIQRFHQETRGWADIAYSWLYSPRHRLWYEGRGQGVAGAHTRNHNRTSHAVCVLGNYQSTELPDTAVDDLAEWAAWHATAWGPGTYRPHNAVTATACPGTNILARLDLINTYAEAPYVQKEREFPATLRIGARGDDVRLLQAALMPHDGVFGPQTLDALKQYQQANGLTVDGICGPQTWRSILDS